jgi:DNA primase
LTVRFEDEFIEKIKDSTDIVAVVGEYVQLKKAGSSWKGLCPFHREKSPSFIVSPSRGSFHCFGCGKGGNVLTFLMAVENLPFPEAVKTLAQKAGIPLPKVEHDEATDARERERARIWAINESAAKFFQAHLNSTEGATARSYLQKRGLNESDSLALGLGWAPAGWETLKHAATKSGYKPEEMVAAGLLVKNEEKGSIYDKFRDRVIFPVRDTFGRILAFGGRIMGDGEPKYLNSPETIVFKKGECLYLLDAAREKIREKGTTLVVEGYFDAIALHLHGFQNAVATLGTALTREHARLLKRYAPEVVVLYDADAAGQAAAKRGIEPLLSEGLRTRVLTLPDAKDPDEYLQKHPKEDLAALVEGAPDFFRWRAAGLKPSLVGQPRENVFRALSELTPLIARLPDEASIQAACSAVESELGLDNRSLLEIVNSDRRKVVRTAVKNEKSSGPALGAPPPPEIQREDPYHRKEMQFLALLAGDGGKFIPWAKEEMAPHHFEDVELRGLFEALPPVESGAESLRNAPALERVFLEMEAEPTKFRNREPLLAEITASLKRRALKKRVADLNLSLRSAESAGDVETAAKHLQELTALKMDLSALDAEE